MRNGLQAHKQGTSASAEKKMERDLLKHNPLLEGSGYAFLEYLRVYGTAMGLSPLLVTTGVDSARCIINAYSGKFEKANKSHDDQNLVDTQAWIQDIVNTDIFAAQNIIALLGNKNDRTYWLSHYLTKLAKSHDGDFLTALYSDEHVEPMGWVRIVFNHLQAHARKAFDAIKSDSDIPMLLPPKLKRKELDVCTSTCFSDAIVELSSVIFKISEEMSAMGRVPLLHKGHTHHTHLLSLASTLLKWIATHGYITPHDNAESLFRAKKVAAHFLSCKAELIAAYSFFSFDYPRLEEFIIEGCTSMLDEDASSLFQP